MTRLRALSALPVALIGCSEPTASPVARTLVVAEARATDGPVLVCHRHQEGAHPIAVAPEAIGAHLAHGDHVARFIVDPSAATRVDGVHYARITDALHAARAIRVARGERETAACRITIDVAAGTFVGSFDASAPASLEKLPLIIDVPFITLRGALRMQVDARGRATGLGRSAAEVTALEPDRPIEFMPNTEAFIVVAGNPGDFAGQGTEIEGFAFRSGRSDGTSGGMGIISLRVRDLLIRGNRFEAGLTSAADLRATSAIVERNHGFRLGVNCAFCLAGPGDFVASGNTLLEGGLGGIYVSATVQHFPFSLGAAPDASIEPYVQPSSASTTAVLRNNDIRRHRRLPIGFAVRVLAIGPGASHVPQATSVVLDGNDLRENTFGLIVDAGFPQANTLRRGDVDVTLVDNAITGNCQSDLLVAFTRHTGALGTTNNPYLTGSTYQLALGTDLAWSNAWYAHAPGLGNTLLVNGAAAPPGTSVAYDPNRICTP